MFISVFVLNDVLAIVAFILVIFQHVFFFFFVLICVFFFFVKQKTAYEI